MHISNIFQKKKKIGSRPKDIEDMNTISPRCELNLEPWSQQTGYGYTHTHTNTVFLGNVDYLQMLN